MTCLTIQEASRKLHLEQTASDALAKVKEVEESKKEELAVLARAKKEELEAAEKKYKALEQEMLTLKSKAHTSEMS